MSFLGDHVTIFTHFHCNDQTLYEFRVNLFQGGAPGQFVPFRAVALGVNKISMQ